MTARGLRGFGFGFAAVLVGIQLELDGLPPALIGLTLGIGLAAASLGGLAAVALASRVGRRRVLALTGLLMCLTGLDLALATAPPLLVRSGLTGMLGAASVDLGPFAPLEQSALAEVTPAAQRNLAFGRYALTGGGLGAVGALAAGAATASSGRWFFLLYGAIGLISGALALFLSRRAEPELRASLFAPLRDPSTFRMLGGLAALFALDSLAGGLVASAVIAYWLHVRFGAAPALLGPCFAAIAILQSLSYEISARISVRIGLINTMVFTHLPSNVLLLLVAFTPSFAWAIALLLARFMLSQMDVPARQAYLVSIVPAPDRSSALAITGAVRGIAQSAGPLLAGAAIGAAAFGVPFLVGGGLKIVYDLLLFAGFRGRTAGPES